DVYRGRRLLSMPFFEGVHVRLHGLWVVLIGLAVVGVVRAQTAPAPATQDAKWRSLIERLSSNDFAAREAAQKELDNATWRDRGVLEQLAKADIDEEAKGRFATRLLAIEEQVAVDPPPISVELKNA